MHKKKLKHFSSLTGMDCNVFDVKLKRFEHFENTFCAKCPKVCDYTNTHLYGCYEAVRWDNKYIYYCPMDLIFVSVPVMDEYGILSSGVVIGPLQMGETEDFSRTTINVPRMDTGKVNDLAEIASALFSIENQSNKKEDVGEFLNTIYKELELLPSVDGYPIELEKKIQESIAQGNEKSAKEYLNRLLGEIFFRSNGDFKVIKARALELVVLLSRSAIDGGADAEQIFSLNDNYIKEIEKFDTIEKLGMWLSSIINRFIGYVFEFKAVRHSVTIRKIIGYIHDNYMCKITLDEIAEHVYMSKSYVSKIFNEEIGENISVYVNKIRIEKSCKLLRDPSLTIAEIANLVGFENQSYFAKQFKMEIGVSPKEFREKFGVSV
jgi:AraC-like DNA-binding protein/ligand-binding sensor protein